MTRKRYIPEALREMQTAPGMWPVKGAAKAMRDTRPVSTHAQPSKRVVSPATKRAGS